MKYKITLVQEDESRWAWSVKLGNEEVSVGVAYGDEQDARFQAETVATQTDKRRKHANETPIVYDYTPED